MVLLYDLEMADLSRRCHLIAYVQEEALESSTHNFQTFIFAETGGCRYCEQLWCNLTHWMHKLMLNEDTLHGWSLFQTGVVEAACSSGCGFGFKPNKGNDVEEDVKWMPRRGANNRQGGRGRGELLAPLQKKNIVTLKCWNPHVEVALQVNWDWCWACWTCRLHHQSICLWISIEVSA